MKTMLRKMLFLFALSTLFSGCAKSNSTTAGAWVANIGKVNFMQKGTKITGSIEGYGEQWKETFEGTITDNKAVFNTEWFGDFTLVFDGDTFKSASPDLAFCGIRSGGIRSDGENELPVGCGYSGKWTIPDKPVFPKVSYV